MENLTTKQRNLLRVAILAAIHNNAEAKEMTTSGDAYVALEKEIEELNELLKLI